MIPPHPSSCLPGHDPAPSDQPDAATPQEASAEPDAAGDDAPSSEDAEVTEDAASTEDAAADVADAPACKNEVDLSTQTLPRDCYGTIVTSVEEAMPSCTLTVVCCPGLSGPKCE